MLLNDRKPIDPAVIGEALIRTYSAARMAEARELVRRAEALLGDGH